MFHLQKSIVCLLRSKGRVSEIRANYSKWSRLTLLENIAIEMMQYIFVTGCKVFQAAVRNISIRKVRLFWYLLKYRSNMHKSLLQNTWTFTPGSGLRFWLPRPVLPILEISFFYRSFSFFSWKCLLTFADLISFSLIPDDKK